MNGDGDCVSDDSDWECGCDCVGVEAPEPVGDRIGMRVLGGVIIEGGSGAAAPGDANGELAALRSVGKDEAGRNGAFFDGVLIDMAGRH